MALLRVHFAGHFRARVSTFVDDITFFVSICLDIEAVKKAVARYKGVAGAKVNLDRSEALRLGSWRGGVPQPGRFRWSGRPVCMLGMWFGPDLQIK